MEKTGFYYCFTQQIRDHHCRHLGKLKGFQSRVSLKHVMASATTNQPIIATLFFQSPVHISNVYHWDNNLGCINNTQKETKVFL